MFFKKRIKATNKPEEIKKKDFYFYQIVPDYSNAHVKEADSISELTEGYTRVDFAAYHYGFPMYAIGGSPSLGYLDYYAKIPDIEEAIKNLVEVPNNLVDIFEKICRVSFLFYEGKYYTTQENFTNAEDYLKEQKPKIFPNSKKVYFFKIGDQYYESSTPSYWLFLYKEFGYLNKDKLKDLD